MFSMENRFSRLIWIRHVPEKYRSMLVCAFLFLLSVFLLGPKNASPLPVQPEGQPYISVSEYQTGHTMHQSNAAQGVQQVLNIAGIYRGQAHKIQNSIYFHTLSLPLFRLGERAKEPKRIVHSVHFQLRRIIPARAGPCVS